MNRRRDHQQAHPDAERGSALVMAIVFVTVIGLAMAIALGYAAATTRATAKAYVPARTQFYAADTALKAAVAFVRENAAEGRYTGTTAGAHDCAPERTYGTVDTKLVTSQVCPRTESSLVGGGGGDTIGVRTLATGDEDGIELGGQGGLTVYGSVRSNSAITVGNSSRLDVYVGTVQAVGGCNRNVYVDGALLADCTVPASPAPAVDPMRTITPPTGLVAGTGVCSDDVATLLPGVWTADAWADAIGRCSYVHLVPGYHVFDDADITIKERVVGGTLTGDITTSAQGEACATRSEPGEGVTMVLGGTSKLTLSGAAASLEVCGEPHTQANGSIVRLPLYGLKEALVGEPGPVTMTNSGNPSQTNTAAENWGQAGRARDVDGSSATVTLGAGASSEEVRIPGFNSTPAVPADVTELSVAVTASATAAATVSVVGRTSADVQVCAPVTSAVLPSALGVTTVTLTCTAPVPADLRIGVTATATAAATVSLDGVAVSYTAASVLADAQSGCIAQVGGCAALSTTGNDNFISLEGELYMPLAMVDIQLPNTSGAFTTRGITLRVLKVRTPASVVVTPEIATDFGTVEPGDVTIVVRFDGTVYMTCRVTFETSGRSITGSTVRACTSPR